MVAKCWLSSTNADAANAAADASRVYGATTPCYGYSCKSASFR
jgi:hypothetical protein